MSQLENSPSANPHYLVIHKVHCFQQDTNHKNHETTTFLDTPRLFEGDSKVSPLRGTQKFHNVDHYLEDHPEVNFLVERKYSCEEYHELKRTEFERLQIPTVDPETALQLRPYLFVLRKSVEPATPGNETLTVLSQDLRSAIDAMKAHFSANFVNWVDDMRFRLDAPYLPLHHIKSLFNDWAPQLLNKEELKQARLLFEYVQSSYGADYEEADELFSKGQVSKTHLYTLFLPGETVVTYEDGQPLAFSLQSCSRISGRHGITLRCYNWDFDGAFHRAQHSIEVYWPKSDPAIVPIDSLEAYPLRSDRTGLEQRLRVRGQTFWGLRKGKLVSYESDSRTFEMPVTIPRYMVDISMHRQLSDDSDIPEPRDDLGQHAMDNDTPPEDPFVLLLPAYVKGFGFHDKKWRNLLVEDICPVQWNKRAFRQIILAHHKKELIEALVSEHVAMVYPADVVEGKGNGLIILLHGGPGTGKTLTAESVAEIAEKPLYRVTCGNIGTEPETAEKYLESVLHIGSIWKAVVLLDESDVFLEERSQMDLKRNALVSVFLRVLEYYEGILILTSNRVGLFDEAFKSRVQLALHYPPLDENGRWKIWQNILFLLRNEPGSRSINYEELENRIDSLARHSLNGRQIRNAIKSARQLANHRKQTLDCSHLEQVISVLSEFERDIADAHGHSDNEWAKFQHFRSE
ncbi:P-loop containing nucleoside triphosphate hydrolase protein [Lineolata rhizophorae]|uniref:P-loop containing nucleoside triphosphate hydrolase protein n=1 Tax=Lineolata rhizophorae TaxID=578093 RepID=A0A6A6NXC9_9PEZI|nr:P-loop containing nucleoside triphosphate hydrolase protein [Lineolata rhizophorae]